MRRIIMTSALALALAATSAFAAQNKNAGKKTTNAAAAKPTMTSNKTGSTASSAGKTRRHRKHRRHAKSGAKTGNKATGNMK